VSYLTPKSLQEALAALGTAGVSVVAGGTDWFPARGDRITDQPVLDISALPGFRGISQGQGLIRIGAATTWSDLIAADLPSAFDGLKAAAREVGSVQIQNAATIAGNLCNASPAADGVPPLLTLDAQVELVSAQGRRILPLDQFILGPRHTALQPGELLAAVLVPEPEAGSNAAFLKAGARRYLVISIASAAAVLAVDKGHVIWARVSVGSCSAVAQRLFALEQSLIGCSAEDLPMVTADHLAALAPISDVRASAEYRLEMAGVLVSRVLAMAAQGGRQHG
jgi:CO/xanthine dehydrogenase FAD-binding subunit